MKLSIGDKSPNFKGVLQNGKEISLAGLKGNKFILYFYPKNNTSGCTAQACNLRDNHSILKKQGYIILGISSDSEVSHQKFIDKHDLPFDLIADTDKSIHELFGTWIEKSMYGRKYMGTVRTTFVIDENGTISDIIKKVKTKEHTAQLLK